MQILDYGQYIRKITANVFTGILEKYNLTINELSIILYLHSENGGKNTAQDIVKELLFTKSHVSSSVDSLVKKGYLEKKADYQDKKKMHLIVKPKANVIFEDSKCIKENYFKILFKNFSEEEKELSSKIFNKMYENIKEYCKDNI